MDGLLTCSEQARPCLANQAIGEPLLVAAGRVQQLPVASCSRIYRSAVSVVVPAPSVLSGRVDGASRVGAVRACQVPGFLALGLHEGKRPEREPLSARGLGDTRRGTAARCGGQCRGARRARVPICEDRELWSASRKGLSENVDAGS